jgi:hypothetical protein
MSSIMRFDEWQDSNGVPVADGTNVPWVTNTGLQLVRNEVVSSVSSASFNNVFTAEYTNYRIVVSALLGSANVNFLMRFRASGTDFTASNYVRALSGHRTTGGAFTDLVNSSTAIRLGTVTTSNSQNNMAFDVFNPVATQITGVYGGTIGGDATSYYTVLMGGALNTTYSADGFTLLPDSGTFSCIVSVYGYVG